MDDLGDFVVGALVAAAGIAALFVAAAADDGAGYAAGVAAFALAMAFEFWLIKRRFDDAPPKD
ncbi:MAG: hypothetical protein JNL66_02695 [Alphaproteobacteria bacterium]|nr:hypothetical protein [Alphaproteobacteria bacterium]